MIFQKSKVNSIFLLNFLFFLFLLFPILAGAQSGTTNPNTPGGTFSGIVYECNPPGSGECDFNDILLAIQKIANWGTIFAIQFSVVIIAYAGFKYMISGDNAGERKKASGMLSKVAIGMAVILLAWVLVQLIISGLLLKPGINTFLG